MRTLTLLRSPETFHSSVPSANVNESASQSRRVEMPKGESETKGEAVVGHNPGCVVPFARCPECGRVQPHYEPAGFAHYPDFDIYDRFICGTFSRHVKACPTCKLCVEDGFHSDHHRTYHDPSKVER
jgi:hypothetical protein